MKKRLVLLLTVVMIFSLAACGNHNTVSTEGSAASTDAAKSYKKEVILTANVAFGNPDPQTATTFQNTRHYQLVYDRLVYYNPETTALEPMLATKWESNEAKTEYTFTLRNDVTFHNGEKFTADDFVFTWERGKESKTSIIKNYYSAIKEIEVINDTSFKAVLTGANADFVYTLTFPYMAVLNREACEKDAEKGFMIGTGLWKWDEHVDNDYDTFLRNDSYWGGTTPTEKIKIRLIPEAATRLVALENGEVDVCINLSDNDTEYVKANNNLVLTKIDTVTLQYMNWNMSKQGPWQDENFRKAFAAAINYDDFIFGAKNGNAMRATTIWSHAQYGYVNLPGYEYNEAKAKEYLSKSNYKGEKIEIITQSSAYTKMATVIQDMVKKVGITVEVNEIGSTNYSAVLKEAQWDSALYQISFTVPGSDVTRLLISSTQGMQSLNNSPNEAKVKELLDKALVEFNDATRKDLYKQVQELLAEDACYIPLCYPQSYHAANKKVSGIVWASNTDFDYRFVKVEE